MGRGDLFSQELRKTRSGPFCFEKKLSRSWVEGPPVRFSWPDGNKALRDIVAVPQSFFCAFFHLGPVSIVSTAAAAKIYCAAQHSAAFVDFHFNTNGLS
ncbi:hypothetical protein [Rhizobium leguminosarum]|uniref:Uncharacterized protein n=1 Tax=Rhizobium leguminosarum TaxID=384 RepID=A0A7K3VK89_RHILE|nr:hypothetical protein [Rhizobium leguminosarum]NEK17620.1 hypothetical protein [Rhizobium leguminosarum]